MRARCERPDIFHPYPCRFRVKPAESLLMVSCLASYGDTKGSGHIVDYFSCGLRLCSRLHTDLDSACIYTSCTNFTNIPYCSTSTAYTNCFFYCFRRFLYLYVDGHCYSRCLAVKTSCKHRPVPFGEIKFKTIVASYGVEADSIKKKLWICSTKYFATRFNIDFNVAYLWTCCCKT